MIYLWVKSFHLIFVVAWMAGLLMYPRLKIYQLKSQPGEVLWMEMQAAADRLRQIILTPSIMAVWILGLSMVVLNPVIASGGWFAAKMILVFLISAFHGWFIGMGKRIDAQTGTINVAYLRMLNEVPFIAMIAVVILVIVKPF